ncbi:MAG: SpoIIE family protein phosphatase [Crocinitomicaceae bacterium]|nr:SpoIIE family protein phosphatase [Crocinitomicaceae bacterium]
MDYVEGVALGLDSIFLVNPVTQDSVKKLDRSHMTETNESGFYEFSKFNAVNENPEIVKTEILIEEESSLPQGFENLIIGVDSFYFPFENIVLEPMAPREESYFINTSGDSILSGREFVQKPRKTLMPKGRVTSVELPYSQNDMDLSVQILNFSSGLPSSQINHVFIDSRGLMWFSFNYSGFGYYDGRYLTMFGKEDGFPNQIWEINEDETGQIWISSDERIMRYDGEYLYSWAENNSWGVKVFRDNYPDKDGNRWINSFNGIFKLENDSLIKHFSATEGFFDDRPIGAAFFKEDYQFMISWNKIGVINTKENSCVDITPLLPNDYEHFVNIITDMDGNIWITSRMLGLIKYDGTYFKRYKIDAEVSDVQIMMESQNSGDFWIGAENTVFRWTPEGKVQEVYTAENGLRDSYYVNIVEDKAGNVWVSGLSGCFRINSDAGRFNGLYDLKVFKENLKYGVAETLEEENGNIWMGLYGWNPEKQIQFDAKGRDKVIPTNGLIESSSTDNSGNKWFATYVDAYWINKENSFLYSFAEGSKAFTKGMNKPYAYFSQVIANTDSTTFISSYCGLYKYDLAENSISLISKKNGLLTSSISDMTFHDQKLFCGTPGKGIMKMDLEHETFEVISEEEGLSHNKVIQLLSASNSTLWVATEEGGINILSNDSIIYFNTNNGLMSNEVTAMFEDQDGDFWVTQVLPNSDVNVIQYIQTKNSNYPKNFDIHTFSYSDGLSLGLIGLRSSKSNSQNLITWGSTFGLYTLDKNKLRIPDTTASVKITDIRVNQERIDFNAMDTVIGINYKAPKPFSHVPENLELDSDKGHLSFYFSNMEWGAPQKVLFSHRVRTVNETWSIPVSDAYADYRNLPYGEHTFEVRAKGESGEWSEITSYDFIILPPWYQTLWARSLYVLFALVIVYIIVQLRTRRLKQKQAELEYEIVEATIEIRNQKDEISEQHKEITDSIVYAKRIQSAILPPINLVEDHLPEVFILYKPKDIVAGDFYWFSPLDRGALIAAADCTGHGVPGAMVSVLCNGALNRAVREFNLSEPGEVLTKTREIVIEEFEKSEEEVKDGMDIALCALEGRKLKYAGAHNPLWIIRNGGDEVEEIKADKQPVGKFENGDPFKTHEVELNEGDTFYLFSDGFADQFGGEKGKKFKSANFKRLLLSIQSKSIQEQLGLLDQAFESWRGNLEQLDDVCVIGVRV